MQAACGISNKPKEQIVDIDAVDAKNELAAVEYVEDLYRFYKEAEVKKECDLVCGIIAFSACIPEY